MKKVFLYTLVLMSVFCGSQVQAQETSSSSSEERNFLVGLRAGISIFDMRYSSSDFSIYKHHYGVREQIGVFAEYDYLWKGLSLRFDVLYSPRGVKLTWKDIDYRLRSYYLDLRLPISYTFLRDKKVQPYVTIAPNVNFVMNGLIRYSSDHSYYEVDFSKANFRSVDFSLFFGVGVKAPIQVGKQILYVGGEFGYNLGFCNTFSNMELQNFSDAVNVDMYDVSGTRKNGGFELAVNVAWMIPHKAKTPKVEKPAPAPAPLPEPEPVIEREPEPENVIEYKSKDCYSIEEMQAFMTLNLSIEDKRICMFDLKFEFGSAVLKHQSEKQLDKFVELFQQFPNTHMEISGHTDNVGSDEYNQKLSENRAKSVYDYFIKKGIAGDRMTIKGYGSKYPIDTNETDEGRARNRRVEIDIQM